MEFVDLSEAMDIPADDIPHTADFDAIIDDLPARNRQIAREMLFWEKSCSRIASEMGLTVSQVRQARGRILRFLYRSKVVDELRENTVSPIRSTGPITPFILGGFVIDSISPTGQIPNGSVPPEHNKQNREYNSVIRQVSS